MLLKRIKYEWSNFTKAEFNKFKIKKYTINDDNKLLIAIKEERSRIIKFINNTDIKLNITKIEYGLNDKIKLYGKGHFIDMNIHNVLDTIPYEYTVIWNGNNKMHIKCTVKQYESFKQRLGLMIHLLEYIRTTSEHKDRIMNIYLILTPLTKSYPETHIIKVPNVNTGYTDFNENIIFIWRYEEFEKVLLHEVIHYFDKDCRNLNYDDVLPGIKINDGNSVHSDERYYEAYTDFYAIYYHLIYLSLVTRVKIKHILSMELTFICNQAQQVNKHLQLGDWSITPSNIINQDTSAFSYYIIKYLIFDYVLHNGINELKDYSKLLYKITNDGFKSIEPIKTEYLRMSLLQLS